VWESMEIPPGVDSSVTTTIVRRLRRLRAGPLSLCLPVDVVKAGRRGTRHTLSLPSRPALAPALGLSTACKPGRPVWPAEPMAP
jgi:hypothetical protein